MTRKQLEKRYRLMSKGCCPRCGKPVDPWPLSRPDNCGLGVAVCIRTWPAIMNAERRLWQTAKG